MQPSKPQPFRLPQRFDSPTLAKYAIPGEPTVIVRAVGVGSTAPFEYSDRNGRQAIFRYEREYDAHVLKVPASVWNHNKGFMAHELMDQRRLPHPLVVTVEVPIALPSEIKIEPAGHVQNLIDAMKADPEYAWSWHCNLAMAMHDSGAGPHSACNRGAALFLSLLSDGAVDTTQHPAYKQTQDATNAAGITHQEAQDAADLAYGEGFYQRLIEEYQAANTDDPLPLWFEKRKMERMKQEILSKSQDGQEAKSSGPYPENAGASPAPATTSKVYQILIDLVRSNRPLILPWLEAVVEATETYARLVVKDTEMDGKKITLTFRHADKLAADALQRQIRFFNDELSGVFGEPLEWCFNVLPPEMDAPGNSEEASDVVVGQVSEQPGASATFSPDGSGTDMPTVAPAPSLYARAWEMLESPMRLKELAAVLETDAETLKASIQDPLSAVELGHAGWVKRREPQA